MQTMEESLEGIFNMVQVNPVRRRCSAQVMQLGVDPHKVCSIISCRIV